MSGNNYIQDLRSQVWGGLETVSGLYYEQYMLLAHAQRIGSVITTSLRNDFDPTSFLDVNEMNESELRPSVKALEGEISEVKADITLLTITNKNASAQSIIQSQGGEITRTSPSDRQAWIEKQLQAFRESNEEQKAQLLQSLNEEMSKTNSAVDKAKDHLATSEEPHEKTKVKTLRGFIEDIVEVQKKVKAIAVKVRGGGGGGGGGGVL